MISSISCSSGEASRYSTMRSDVAVVVAHDAAVVLGVVQLDGGERGGGVGVQVPLVELGDELAVDQRHVAVQHHDVAVEALERLEAGADGVAGAAPLLLHRALAAHGEDLGDGVLVGAGDDHDALGRDAERGVDDVREHGPAAHLVQHLGAVGLHARAQARRQDDDCERRALLVCGAHLAHLVACAAGVARRRTIWRDTGWGGRIRTSGCRDQNPVPYHLATPQRRTAGAPHGGRPPAAKAAEKHSTRARRRPPARASTPSRGAPWARSAAGR